MLVLGIESSCDETAAAVVEDGVRIRSNVVASQATVHAEYGGVVPEIASRLHAERMLPVLDEALRLASIKLDHVDRVAVSSKPGLVGALLVGVSAAKAIAWTLGKPLVGVNHVHAHLIAPFLDSDARIEDSLPALGLVASGGHTSLYLVDRGDDGAPTFERLGGTIDDAVGETYDKVASLLGLGYPGGPVVDRLAREASEDEVSRMPRLPVSRLSKDSLDLSFSGLKTAVLYAARGVPQAGKDGLMAFRRNAGDLSQGEQRSLCASFQNAACSALMLKTERAFDVLHGQGDVLRSLVIGGGVAANSELRSRVERFAASRGVPALIPPLSLCVDNAAMIAALGSHMTPATGAEALELDATARAGS